MKFRTALLIAVITVISALSLIPKYVQWKNSVPTNRPASSLALSGENAIRHLKENGEYESLGAAVTEARYEADLSGEAATAENHANRMHASFSPDGLVLESTAPNANWKSRWRLQNLGHGNQQATLGSGDVQTDGGRVTIKRSVARHDESAIPNPQSSKSGSTTHPTAWSTALRCRSD